MPATPLVRGSAYLPFLQHIENAGAPVGRTFVGDLVPAIVQRDPEALVPVHLAHAFLARCARVTGHDDLGYVIGRHARVEGLGAYGRYLVRSLTLNDGLGKIRSSFALYSSAETIWYRCSGRHVEFLHRHLCDTGPGSVYAQQCALLLMRDFVRLAAGPAWQPQEVTITSKHDVEAARQTFETDKVRVAEFCGFTFPAEFLGRTLSRATAERDLAAFEASAPAGDFVGSVKQAIASLMAGGQFHLSVIAGALGMHPRRLQRRLSASGHEYSNLLAEVRFEAAVRMLDDPALRVIDVAGALGYADSANFTRAFRQWTSMSPSTYRGQRGLSPNDMTRPEPIT